MQPSDQSQVFEALRTVIDPEVGVNVVDLGLVYAVDCDERGVRVKITMSTPACPLGESIVEDARAAVRKAVGDNVNIGIELVWEPAWTPERMTDAARDALGW